MASKKTEADDLIRLVREQGFEVLDTTKGWKILGKDGKSFSIVHKTNSDWRWRRNKLAELRRMGFVDNPRDRRK